MWNLREAPEIVDMVTTLKTWAYAKSPPILKQLTITFNERQSQHNHASIWPLDYSEMSVSVSGCGDLLPDFLQCHQEDWIYRQQQEFKAHLSWLNQPRRSERPSSLCYCRRGSWEGRRADPDWVVAYPLAWKTRCFLNRATNTTGYQTTCAACL